MLPEQASVNCDLALGLQHIDYSEHATMSSIDFSRLILSFHRYVPKATTA